MKARWTSIRGPSRTNLSAPNGSADAFIAKYDGSGALVWAKRLGGPGEASGLGIAVDSGGAIYVTGYFNETADFDPGPGTLNVISKGNADIFIAKFSNNGNPIWAKQFGGGADDEAGISIAVDAGGNVVTTGVFTGVSDFDPGPGAFNMTAAGVSDIFVAKLDSNGGFAWAKRMGGAVDVPDDVFDVGTDIAVDFAGNVYATGFFLGTADFDPGPGVLNFVSAGQVDAFVSKFAPGGTLLWARQLGGTGQDGALGIGLDANANVYTAGGFGATVDFDPGPGVFNVTAKGQSDSFVWKLDTNGNFVWARTVGGPGAEIAAAGMAADSSGSVYTSGLFAGTVDFDPGPAVFNRTGPGSGDGYVSKLDSNGAFAWTVRIGGSADGSLGGLALDGTGHMFATGSFDGTVDFDPGPGSTKLTSVGGDDFFLAKLKDNSVSGVTPVISSGGVVMANLLPTINTVSPLSIISVFGQDFSTESILFPNLDGEGKLDTVLGGTCLMMNGEALPIFAMTPTQINAQVTAAKVLGPASFTVVSNCGTAAALASEPARFGSPLPRELTSAAEPATVEAATPAFFIFNPVASNGYIAARFNATETQTAAAVAPAGLFNDQFGPSRPAKPGDIILMYGTGWGDTTAHLGTGVLAGGAASVVVEAAPSITFGGVPLAAEDIFYVGVTPGTAGLYQAAIRIPATAQAGNNQVVLTVYGKSTPVGPVVAVALERAQQMRSRGRGAPAAF